MISSQGKDMDVEATTLEEELSTVRQ